MGGAFSARTIKGVALVSLERPGEAIAAYDELSARFGDASELTLQSAVERARALRDGTGRR
jgi:hypothetical protein